MVVDLLELLVDGVVTRHHGDGREGQVQHHQGQHVGHVVPVWSGRRGENCCIIICLMSGDSTREKKSPPVASGVVQCAAGPHWLKVIDAPTHEGDGGPEDGQDPDDAAHGQRGAPEELLSCGVTSCSAVLYASKQIFKVF